MWCLKAESPDAETWNFVNWRRAAENRECIYLYILKILKSSYVFGAFIMRCWKTLLSMYWLMSRGGQCSGDYGRIFGWPPLLAAAYLSNYLQLPWSHTSAWLVLARASDDLCFLITSECNVIPPTCSHQPTAGTTQMEKYFTSTKTVSRDGE